MVWGNISVVTIPTPTTPLPPTGPWQRQRGNPFIPFCLQHRIPARGIWWTIVSSLPPQRWGWNPKVSSFALWIIYRTNPHFYLQRNLNINLRNSDAFWSSSSFFLEKNSTKFDFLNNDTGMFMSCTRTLHTYTMSLHSQWWKKKFLSKTFNIFHTSMRWVHT